MPSVTTPARTVAIQDSSVEGIALTNIDSTGYRQVFMSESRNCRNFIQVHTNIDIVVAQSRASIVITVVEQFPESSEVTGNKARLAEEDKLRG